MNRYLPLWVILACLSGTAPAWAQAGPLSIFAVVEDHEVQGGVAWADGVPARNMRVDVLGPDGKSIGMARTDSGGHFRFLPAKRIDHTLVVDDGEGHFANFLVPAARLPKEPLLVGVPKSSDSAAGGGMPKVGKAPARPPVTAEKLAPPPGYKASPPPEKGKTVSESPSSPVLGPESAPEQAGEEAEVAAPPVAPSLDRDAITEIVRDVVASEMATALTPLEDKIEGYERRSRFADILTVLGALLGIAGAVFWMNARRLLRSRDALQKPPEGSMVNALPAGEPEEEQKETP